MDAGAVAVALAICTRVLANFAAFLRSAAYVASVFTHASYYWLPVKRYKYGAQNRPPVPQFIKRVQNLISGSAELHLKKKQLLLQLCWRVHEHPDEHPNT